VVGHPIDTFNCCSRQLLRAIALNVMKSIRGHHTATVGYWSVTHDNMEFVGAGVDEIRWDAYLHDWIVDHRSISFKLKVVLLAEEFSKFKVDEKRCHWAIVI
jgi:hypothetical protein